MIELWDRLRRYLLPYQVRWVESAAPMLLGEKIQAGGPADPAQSSFFQAYYEHTLRLN